MKELGITKGGWVGVDYAGHYSIQVAPFYGARDLLDKDETNEAEANMQLCCDAGNTAQKCGLLPSELLQQRDELREALGSAIKIIRCSHGIGMLEDEERAIWEIYSNHAPEMKKLKAAIKNTETK